MECGLEGVVGGELHGDEEAAEDAPRAEPHQEPALRQQLLDLLLEDRLHLALGEDGERGLDHRPGGRRLLAEARDQTANQPDDEIARLEAALKEGAAQLQALVHKAPGGEVADILSMHEEMLDDPELHQAAIDAIREGRSAEAGWWEAIDTAAHAQEMLADRLLAERAADLRDVGRRVLGVLCDVSLPEPPEHPYILVMDDIGPSDVARLDTSRVRGLLTVRGGATAHSAILARALGIPAVVGAGEAVMALHNGSMMILDGERGRVTSQPSEERLRRAEQQLLDQQQREADAWELRFEQAQTRDGHRVEVAANLGNTAHAADAVERGAEGVGLLRTEFLFMAYSSAPDLATQIAEYREATDALDGRPLVARAHASSTACREHALYALRASRASTSFRSSCSRTTAGTSSSSSVNVGGWRLGMCRQSILAIALCIEPRRAAAEPMSTAIIVTSCPCDMYR